MMRRKRLGVISTFVWDTIYGRDPRSEPVTEWGGCAYALSALDASLADDWEIVPLVKVGDDLAPRAREFIATLSHVAPDAALIGVPYPNNRVELRYETSERRAEKLTGGLPGWSWLGLKPLLRDLHMLVHAVQPDGWRTLQPLPNIEQWCRCFDLLQMNEDEVTTVAREPLELAATAMIAGVRSLTVTLGSRGAVYFAAPGFERLADLESSRAAAQAFGPLRTALVPVDVAFDAGDPTGCGDVWGATCFSRLLAGDDIAHAMRAAHGAAARNVMFRGATGLARHLRGELITR